MVVSVIFPLRQQLFCWSIKPPYSTISLTQDYLECPCSYWMDGPFCISFLAFAQTSPSCVFLEEPIWSAMALPSYIPWDTIAFSFLMTFAQSSISDMFQHRNQCWSRSQWQVLCSLLDRIFLFFLFFLLKISFPFWTCQHYLLPHNVLSERILNSALFFFSLRNMFVKINLFFSGSLPFWFCRICFCLYGWWTRCRGCNSKTWQDSIWQKGASTSCWMDKGEFGDDLQCFRGHRNFAYCL